jgi:hypothetical protein
MVRAIERLTRPRLPLLTGDVADTFTGLVCVMLALIMALPIPFGDALPGIALVLFALGMMQRDGVAILLGVVATAAMRSLSVPDLGDGVEVAQHVTGWFAQYCCTDGDKKGRRVSPTTLHCLTANGPAATQSERLRPDPLRGPGSRSPLAIDDNETLDHLLSTVEQGGET